MNTIENYNRAIELLQAVLADSIMENEFDKDIYEFLDQVNEVPDEFEPYW